MTACTRCARGQMLWNSLEQEAVCLQCGYRPLQVAPQPYAGRREDRAGRAEAIKQREKALGWMPQPLPGGGR